VFIPESGKRGGAAPVVASQYSNKPSIGARFELRSFKDGLRIFFQAQVKRARAWTSATAAH
jgi:hypothetical protein